MNTLANFKIIRQNGETYDMASSGIMINSFAISYPPIRHIREEIQNRNGHIDMGSFYGGRQMRAICTLIAVDFPDYELQRNKVFDLFDSRESFFIVRDAEPGKRWFVKVDESFNFERNRLVGEFEVPLISDSPFVESIGTTLDPLTFSEELWQVGQGLDVSVDDYVQQTTAFSIYNAGEKISPDELPLKIKFTGSSSGLTITNVTNGSVWSYDLTSNSGDEIIIEGVRSFKNGVTIFKDTNRKLIKLEKGFNDFQITGTSGSFEITFEFRFYYL